MNTKICWIANMSAVGRLHYPPTLWTSTPVLQLAEILVNFKRSPLTKLSWPSENVRLPLNLVPVSPFLGSADFSNCWSLCTAFVPMCCPWICIAVSVSKQSGNHTSHYPSWNSWTHCSVAKSQGRSGKDIDGADGAEDLWCGVHIRKPPLSVAQIIPTVDSPKNLFLVEHLCDASKSTFPETIS